MCSRSCVSYFSCFSIISHVEKAGRVRKARNPHQPGCPHLGCPSCLSGGRSPCQDVEQRLTAVEAKPGMYRRLGGRKRNRPDNAGGGLPAAAEVECGPHKTACDAIPGSRGDLRVYRGVHQEETAAPPSARRLAGGLRAAFGHRQAAEGVRKDAENTDLTPCYEWPRQNTKQWERLHSVVGAPAI